MEHFESILKAFWEPFGVFLFSFFKETDVKTLEGACMYLGFQGGEVGLDKHTFIKKKNT